MADKRIQDLTPATSVGTYDQFVLQQGGQAKSLTGQILINDLAAALDGHGGISNVSYVPPVSPSLDGTLTITLADGTSYDVTITNGRGISNITWTSSGTPGDGLTHTGTIAYNDGTTSQVQIQDGYKGNPGSQSNLWFAWANVSPTSDNDIFFNSTGPWIGIATTLTAYGVTPVRPTAYTAYAWLEYKGEQGETGSSIASIALTSSVGLVDTYTITLTDGNTSTFNVTNAKSIVSVVMTSGSHAAGTTDVYTITFNDGDTATFSVYNGANGLGSVSTVSGIQADGNGDVPQVISGSGAPTTATVGQVNQLYYDLTNSVLYYCAGESGGTYVWLGAGVTVDSALSSSSENPVQNKVITGRVGTGALPNSNTNLTSAINYVDGRIPAAASQTPLTDTTGGAVGTGTNFARNDHRHPLNVPTSGTPADLGTSSQGSAATYSRSDHVHAMPSASDVGALTSADVNYKIYDSVTDLGLTSGSATISGAWTAMVAPSILICPASDFSDAPNANGTVEIVKASKGYIQFWGNTESNNDYRMFLNASNNPSGTWIEQLTRNSIVAEAKSFGSVSVAGGASKDFSVSVAKTGYTPLGFLSVTGSGTTPFRVTDYYVSGTTAHIWAVNTSSDTKSVTWNPTILYIKN